MNYDIEPKIYAQQIALLRAWVDPENQGPVLPTLPKVGDWALSGYRHPEGGGGEWFNAFDGAAWRTSTTLVVSGSNRLLRSV